MKAPALLALLATGLSWSGLAGESQPAGGTAAGKHLFILSGQSNMVGMDPALSFTPRVTAALGKDAVIIVKDAHSGQSIRSWCRHNHEDPVPTTGRIPRKRGELYDRLMEKVRPAIAGQALRSVTLVWMQGESDLNNTAYDAYLRELLRQLREDLDFEPIHLVLGRISDSGLDQPKRLEGRKTIRKVQVEFAEACERGAWVEDGKLIHDLHYTPEGYRQLGERFATQAVELIRSRPQGPPCPSGPAR